MKQIPARTAVAQAVRDLQIENPNNKINTMIEWVREALVHLDVKSSYTRMECEVTIKDYRAEIPFDCYKLLEVKIGEKYPEHTARSFKLFNKDSENLADRTSGSSLNNLHDNVPQSDMTQYTIENGYINFTIPSGTAGVAYLVNAKDLKTGEPVIDIRLLEAVTAYLVYKVLQSKFYIGKISAGAYTDAKQNWWFACQNARGKVNMPSRSKMDRVGSMWNNLKPWKRIQKN